MLAGTVSAETAGYWRFETNLNDESIHSHNTFAHQGPSFSTNVPVPKVPLTEVANGASISLDRGQGQYLNTVNHSSLSFGGANAAFTIEAYVKLNSLGSGVADRQYMVLKKSGANADAKMNYAFLPRGGDMSSAPVFQLGNGTSVTRYSPLTLRLDNTTAWFYVAVRFDAVANTVIFTVNDQHETVSANGFIPASNDLNLMIGSHFNAQGALTTTFNGEIDELRISKGALANDKLLSHPDPGTVVTPPNGMNVVVLLADDQRWDAFGAGGSDFIHTPNLDALADGNVHFTQARVTTSICNVSRASILTGQYMTRHGVDSFSKSIPDDAFSKTYAGVLRAAGYWSGYVGKDHTNSARAGLFDFTRAYHGRHWYTINGEKIHVTERNARDSLDFLRTRPANRPFLLNLCFFAPHAEDAAPEQYLPQNWSAQHYLGKIIPQSAKMDPSYLAALPPFLSNEANEGRIRYHWRFDTPADYQKSMTNYFRLITEVDEAVGRVVAELKAQGVYEKTLIVFTGDNGYFHADRGLGDKWYPYEESIRVPLIIHDPRLAADKRGIKRDQMVLNIDLAPTIVAAAGLPVPAVMQGEDLAPLYLNDSVPGWRDEFLYEHPTITSKDRIPTSQAVVRQDLKYTHWPEWDHEQLFDLRVDPTEKVNLVNDPAYAGNLAEMRRRLDFWLERAPFHDWLATHGYQPQDVDTVQVEKGGRMVTLTEAYLLGENPNNPQDVLRPEIRRGGSGGFSLEFNASPGRRYDLLHSQDLKNWSEARSGISVTAPGASSIDLEPLIGEFETSGFFQLRSGFPKEPIQ